MVDIVIMVNQTLFVPGHDVITEGSEVAKSIPPCDGDAFVNVQTLTEPWQVVEKFGLSAQDHFETVLRGEKGKEDLAVKFSGLYLYG